MINFDLKKPDAITIIVNSDILDQPYLAAPLGKKGRTNVSFICVPRNSSHV